MLKNLLSVLIMGIVSIQICFAETAEEIDQTAMRMVIQEAIDSEVDEAEQVALLAAIEAEKADSQSQITTAQLQSVTEDITKVIGLFHTVEADKAGQDTELQEAANDILRTESTENAAVQAYVNLKIQKEGNATFWQDTFRAFRRIQEKSVEID